MGHTIQPLLKDQQGGNSKTMKTFMQYLSEVATFSAKNFPDDVGDNHRFPRVGERTTYAPTRVENYKFVDGFSVTKVTPLYNEDGMVMRQLSAGDRVWFTVPATLHRASDFNIKGRSILAPVSLKGHDQEPDGYVTISHIAKPAGGGQARVQAGSKTQDAVALRIMEIASEKGIEFSEDFKTARPHSRAPDLVMTIAGRRTQFEIKGTNNRKAPITFFDKSVRRDGQTPHILDEFAKVYIDNLQVDEGRVASLMREQRLPQTFVGLIDFFRSRDSSIGFPGDEGVVLSGKLPPELTTTDSSILREMRQMIFDHFEEGGDDYFVVHDRSTDDFEIYFVDGGQSGNVLNMPILPRFKSFSLATYGGRSSGRLRAGLKIRL